MIYTFSSVSFDASSNISGGILGKHTTVSLGTTPSVSYVFRDQVYFDAAGKLIRGSLATNKEVTLSPGGTAITYTLATSIVQFDSSGRPIQFQLGENLTIIDSEDSDDPSTYPSGIYIQLYNDGSIASVGEDYRASWRSLAKIPYKWLVGTSNVAEYIVGSDLSHLTDNSPTDDPYIEKIMYLKVKGSS